LFVGDDDTDIVAELYDGECDGDNEAVAEDVTGGEVTGDEVTVGEEVTDDEITGDGDTVIISALSEVVKTTKDVGGSVTVDTGSAVVTIESIMLGCCVGLNRGEGTGDKDGCLVGDTVIGDVKGALHHSPASHAVTPDQQCSPEGHL
jgi:hypothetical protein